MDFGKLCPIDFNNDCILILSTKSTYLTVPLFNIHRTSLGLVPQPNIKVLSNDPMCPLM